MSFFGVFTAGIFLSPSSSSSGVVTVVTTLFVLPLDFPGVVTGVVATSVDVGVLVPWGSSWGDGWGGDFALLL